jgi:hypothetical protein
MAGPAMMRQSSRTRMPVKICGLPFEAVDEEQDMGRKGAGGEACSRGVTVHGGRERRWRP